jgi:hypothetical protein
MRRYAVAGLCVVACLVLANACARRVAPPAPGLPTEPRVSWTIRSGPQGGDDSEVCRSDQQQPCVLQASTPSRPMSVAVSVYMYDAGAPTNYSGALQSSFIEAAGGQGYEAKVDYAIKPAELPTGVTATGRVTSTPGERTLRIALLAEVPNHMDPHQFEQSIPVRVLADGSGAPVE